MRSTKSRKRPSRHRPPNGTLTFLFSATYDGNDLAGVKEGLAAGQECPPSGASAGRRPPLAGTIHWELHRRKRRQPRNGPELAASSDGALEGLSRRPKEGQNSTSGLRVFRP